MNWRQFVMDLETLQPDAVEEVFARHGASSITLTDAGDQPVLEPGPGETPLWPEARITGLFPAETDIAALQADLMSSLNLDALPAHEVSNLEDRDWEREWLKDFGPMRFGRRLWICPSNADIEDENAAVVRLDPGLAFGTGTHPTTALCLEWLDGLDLDNKRILDYGCGSGVLAIAAVKLGADQAVAMDIDSQAVRATLDNAASNEVRNRMLVSNHVRGVAGGFDVVVANILAGPLVELAEPITSHVKGGCLLALSGILSEQVEDVLNAYRPWIEFEEPEFREQDGQTWARLNGRRTEG
ncbi:MAG: 50S ribosomal protein L11 methyltransferase [Woeseiaceae bacterium]